MKSRALIVEQDLSIQELLRATIQAENIQADTAKAQDLDTILASDVGYDFVFWSSSVTLNSQQLELLSKRPDSEKWVHLLNFEENELDSTAFHSHLKRPFRASDLLACLRGEAAPAEDETLRFMRAREKEFTLFRKKETQLREAHRHQTELERMKNTFLSLVSHELRTPLTIISGNLHVLKKLASKWDNNIANECVGSAFDGTTRLNKLVDELLRFTVAVPQSREKWDLSLTLRRVIGELQPLASNRGLDITLHPSNKLVVEGDPSGLPDALHQLVENALLFNTPGGQVDVYSKASSNGKWVEVEIRDNGPGIENSELDKIFRPFYQVADVNTRKVEGLGIGLALARRTVESHGGTLRLASTVGQGTVAFVKIPTSTEVSLPLATDRSIPQPPKEEDLKALKSYSQDLYEGLESERVKRRHAEEQKRVLEQTFVETLMSLIRMVDPRLSGGTSQGERVLNYARAVARHLDPTLLSRPEFLYGMLLYDIGKIGVAESVLSKTGVLTDQEKRSAQAHAEIGAELLTSVGVLRPAIEAVRSHHERWDGSGYPDGLSQKEIPLLARIIAVVDSFDAMTVDRPYRQALSLSQAKKQIIQGAGTSFDPEIVEAFVNAWLEIEQLAKKPKSTSVAKAPISKELPPTPTPSLEQAPN